jgi:hypothetical protein
VRVIWILSVWMFSSAVTSAQNSSRINRKLDGIILPKVKMENLSLSDAVDQLRELSREFDTMETNPEWEGVRIGFEEARVEEPTRLIALDLENATLKGAIDAVCIATNRRFDVFSDGGVLHILPIDGNKPEGMFTRVYRVPTDFLDSFVGGSDYDPFAVPGDKVELPKKRTAKEVLVDYGVTFPEGSFAKYLVPLSILVVKNTSDNIELVEALTVSIGVGPPRLITVRTELY